MRAHPPFTGLYCGASVSVHTLCHDLAQRKHHRAQHEEVQAQHEEVQAQHIMAQHSTVQYSPAQDSPAQDKTRRAQAEGSLQYICWLISR